MTARRERTVFWAAVVACWAFFFVQALHTSVMLDDWYQLTWHRVHPLTLHWIWVYAHYNYFHFNPRIGDVWLMLINGPRWIHLVASPLVLLGLVPVAFAVALGRWPRATLSDLFLLLALQLAIWLIAPVPGVVYFYRPYATNYLWSFATMLALFAPYRIELARAEPGPARPYLAPLMFGVGWIAGMGNEHTGPAAMFAMAVCLVWAWRKRRLRLWMIAGAVGLFIGYPMLFFAPGQHERYAGSATRNTPLKMLRVHGVEGSTSIFFGFFGETQIVIDCLVIGVLVALRRAAGALAPFARWRVQAIGALVGLAALMVVVQFASPTVGERLFFAPAVLVACAALVVADWMLVPAIRRGAAILLAIALGYHVAMFVTMSWLGWNENQERLAILARATPNTTITVPAYRMWKRTPWWWGDDFSYASLRQYVANEMYDLDGIELDQHASWIQPTPPGHFVVTRTFDPPMTPAEEAKITPRYVPTYWEWANVQLRRSLLLGPIADVIGHRLVHYTVDEVGTGFADPQHRPVHVLDWTPERTRVVDGGIAYDEAGLPYIRVWTESVPPDLRDTYVLDCSGKTTRVEPLPEVDGHEGPYVPLDFSCAGTFTVYMCRSDACWLAGRFWR